MKCKNCGLPIEEGEEFVVQYQTRWRHKSRDGSLVKFISCAYANRFKKGHPDYKYSYPTVVATPEVVEGVKPSILEIAAITKPPITGLVHMLPPVTGRRFR